MINQIKNNLKKNDVWKDIKIGTAQLSSLADLKLDKRVSDHLLNIGGKLQIVFEGDSPRAFIALNGKEIPIKEFVEMFRVTAKFVSLSKKKELAKGFDSLHDRIVDVLADRTKAEDIQLLNPDKIGLIGVSLSSIDRLIANMEVCEFWDKKDPKNSFVKYTKDLINISAEVVVEGIVALAKGDKGASEAIAEARKKHHLPGWCYNKLVNTNLLQDQIPERFYFPLNRTKGITLTTAELRDVNFRTKNKLVLKNSWMLIVLVNTESLLRFFVPEVDTLDEVVAQKVLNCKWNLIPPMGEIEDFLNAKAKKTITSTGGGFDLSSKLAKFNNAILRSAMLENSGLDSENLIFRKLFPNGTVTGTVYESLLNQKNVSKRLKNFENLAALRDVGVWYGLLMTELGFGFQRMEYKEFLAHIVTYNEGKGDYQSKMTVFGADEVETDAGVRDVKLSDKSLSANSVTKDSIKKKLFALNKTKGKKVQKKHYYASVLGRDAKNFLSGMERNNFDKTDVEEMKNSLRGIRNAALQDEAARTACAQAENDLFHKEEENENDSEFGDDYE